MTPSPIRVSPRLVGSEEMDEGRKTTETRDISEALTQAQTVQCGGRRPAFKFLARQRAGQPAARAVAGRRGYGVGWP
jgi:hypothetical protein